MKTTQTQKSAVLRPYGVAARRDEVICAQFCQAALTGLLSCNSFYDGDALSFRDGLEAEELLDRAHELGTEAFENFKRWRKRSRAIQALKSNPKVVVKS
jgi:hypothetical protein